MFIRTKDGIYDLEVKDNKDINCYQINDDFEEETYGGKTGRVLYIPSKAVLKQSNDPAELCDGYYLYNGYDDKFNPDRIYTIDEKTKALDDCKDLAFHIDLMCRGRYICELRAFIETDKGLIFIGKFNENEKLVLI